MNLRTETGKPYFYQWDTDQILIVEDAPTCQYVHFGYRDGSGAQVCGIREMDGKRVVDIPNELLQKDRTFFAYLISEEEGGTQAPSQSFVVLMRPKPEDYVYTETEVLNYTYLADRMNALEGEGVKNAVAAYLEENPLEAGATAEEAAQIAQNKENIESVRQQAKNAVKTVNGTAPDENGNVEIAAAGAFVVNVADDITTGKIKADKTIAEIYEAYQSGMLVICVYNGDGIPAVFTPLMIGNTMAVFSFSWESLNAEIIIDVNGVTQRTTWMVKTVNGAGPDENGNVEITVTDGHTPVKGTDYWTEADKAEIKSYVDGAILGGAW